MAGSAATRRASSPPGGRSSERTPARLRGIGEPIWAGRSGAELVECQLHESLLNLAFADATDFRLLCPYDTSLDEAVVHEARRSHPHVDGGRATRSARSVRRRSAPLPPPPRSARLIGFERDTLVDVRRFVEEARAGLGGDRQDLVLAVDELATNSIRHGGGRGILRSGGPRGAGLRGARPGRIADPLAGRRRPELDQFGGRGLWIANQLCDLVQIRPGGQGSRAVDDERSDPRAPELRRERHAQDLRPALGRARSRANDRAGALEVAPHRAPSGPRRRSSRRARRGRARAARAPTSAGRGGRGAAGAGGRRGRGATSSEVAAASPSTSSEACATLKTASAIGIRAAALRAPSACAPPARARRAGTRARPAARSAPRAPSAHTTKPPSSAAATLSGWPSSSVASASRSASSSKS